MKGIKIKNGATFVKCGNVTVRIIGEKKCEISPVMYESLEWELAFEPPDRWDYLSEGEIRALGDDVYYSIIDIARKVDRVLEI